MQEIYVSVMEFTSYYHRSSKNNYLYIIHKVVYNLILALYSLESHAMSIIVDPEMSRAPWKFRNALLSLLRSYLGVIKRRVSSIGHCMYRRTHNTLYRTVLADHMHRMMFVPKFRNVSLLTSESDLIESRSDP